MAYELKAISHYIPSKNVFLITADLTDYLLEYYLQRKDYTTSVSEEQDTKLKELICCFSIHLAARTAVETHAWTLSLVSEAPYSLFVTGNTGEAGEDGVAEGFLIGNILTEHIRHSDTNGFHAQTTNRGRTFNSYVPCDSSEIPQMVERFYRQSEQLPLRISLSATDDTGIGLAALPGYDPEWYDNADLGQFQQEAAGLEKTMMRNCRFSFTCDCSPQKLIPFFRGLGSDAIAELYAGDEELLITCPRCGRRFAVPRSSIEVDS